MLLSLRSLQWGLLAPWLFLAPTNPTEIEVIRRALYRKLLDYSKLIDPQLQLWKEPGPHNWVVRPVRQRCAMCTEKERLRKKLLAQYKDTCIELFKEIANSQVKHPSKSQSGCGFCDVALCKTSSCFQDWHSQKG